MDLSQFKHWARRKLGWGDECGVVVELSDDQLEQCLEDAKDWFNTQFGLHRESSFQLVGGQTEYDLSAVTPAIDDVMKVWFPISNYSIDFMTLYPGFLDINGFPYDMPAMFKRGMPQTTLVQTLQTLESTGRIMSYDREFEFYRDRTTTPMTSILRVMAPPSEAGTAIYLYRIDPSEIKMEWYDPKQLYYVREWALAEAKYTLGRIRGKYPGGLPAAGSDRTLDGEALLSEAQADKERLRTEILNMQGPVMPLVG